MDTHPLVKAFDRYVSIKACCATMRKHLFVMGKYLWAKESKGKCCWCQTKLSGPYEVPV